MIIPHFSSAFFWSLLWGSLFYSCASIAPPKGGPKDTTPPQVVNESPANYHKNHVPGTPIRIEFNEFIEARGLANTLVASPPLENQLAVSVNPKSVEIVIDTPLLDQTTYSLYFGDAVKDFTEGNPLKDYVYIFSTGEQIDSARLQGRAVDLLTGLAPEEDIIAVAYKAENDTGITKERPRYFANARESVFKLAYMKEARYRVYVLQDQNGNMFWDAGEPVAFNPDPIPARADTFTPLLFKLFKPVPRETKLDDYKLQHKAGLQLYFNKRLERFSIEAMSKRTPDWKDFVHPEGDTVTVWFDSPLDTVRKFLLKEGDAVIDTFEFDPNFADSANTPKNVLKPITRIPGQIAWHKGVQLRMRYANPVIIDSSRPLLLYRDTIVVDTLSPITTQAQPNYIKVPLPAIEEPHRIEIPDSLFRDAYGNFQKQGKTIALKPADPQAYAVLEIELSLPEKNDYIVQLVNKKMKVVRSLIHPKNGPVKWNYLQPGSYKLRLIQDNNRNGHWDGGVFLDRQLPEPVQLPEKTIKLRANWEVLDVQVRWQGQKSISP